MYSYTYTVKKIVIVQAKIDQLAGLQAMTHKLWLACNYKGLLWWFEVPQQDGAVIIACTVILHIEEIIAISLQARDPWGSDVLWRVLYWWFAWCWNGEYWDWHSILIINTSIIIILTCKLLLKLINNLFKTYRWPIGCQWCSGVFSCCHG